MFATLVMCLPSLHDDAEIILKYSGSSKIFATLQFSEYGYSYAAWYVYFQT